MNRTVSPIALFSLLTVFCFGLLPVAKADNGSPSLPTFRAVLAKDKHAKRPYYDVIMNYDSDDTRIVSVYDAGGLTSVELRAKTIANWMNDLVKKHGISWYKMLSPGKIRNLDVVKTTDSSIDHVVTADRGSLRFHPSSNGRTDVLARYLYDEIVKWCSPLDPGNTKPHTRTREEKEKAFTKPENWYDQGDLLYFSGKETDINGAKMAYLKAIQLRPDFVDAYLQLAKIYIDTENYEKAKDMLNEAEKHNPVEAQVEDIKRLRGEIK